MDDTISLPPLIDDLSANIEDLTSALAPLLNTPLSTRASSLPLLDKAKLHIHTAYAIESLLFSALQVSGQNAKEHPIFVELGRLKSYFKKVKDAELGSVPRSRIDKDAVGRFIKHGLAGNDRYDKEREERVLKEKAKAKLAEQRMHIKFDKEDEDPRWQAKEGKKRKAEENVDEESSVRSEDGELSGGDVARTLDGVAPAKKKSRVSAADMMEVDSPSSSTRKQKKRNRKKGGAEDILQSTADENPGGKSKEELKAERKSQREERRAQRAATKSSTHQSPMVRRAQKAEKAAARGFGTDGTEEAILPPKNGAPKTRSETFQALLARPLSDKREIS